MLPPDDASPFAPSAASSTYYDAVSASVDGQSTDNDFLNPPPAPAPAPASAPAPAAAKAAAGGGSTESAGIQSFQDLDISPAPGALNPAAAPRFQSKAVEPAAGASSAGTTSPDLAITVSNPTKVGEGMSAYYNYEITTKTSLPQYQFGQFSVTRRFRDFDWLHGVFAAKFPGTIVPPLPEKHVMATSTTKLSGAAPAGGLAEFLEGRRAELQRFLHRVSAHPQLHVAADLQHFLENSEESLESWKESSKPSKSAQAMAKDMASETKNGLLSAYTKALSLAQGAGDASATFTPQADVPCQQMLNYANAVQGQITAVHKHSKSYIERHRALGTSMTGFGVALTQLSSCEAAINDSLSKSISQMGLTVDRLSSMYSDLSDRETAAFEEPMRDYIKLLGSVKHAISARDAGLKALNGAASGLANKKDKLEKARATGGKEEKVGELARQVHDAEGALTVATADYEKVSAMVDTEMARFQREKLSDFKRIVTGFVSLQLEYSRRMQAAWQDLLPHLEAIDRPQPLD